MLENTKTGCLEFLERLKAFLQEKLPSLVREKDILSYPQNVEHHLFRLAVIPLLHEFVTSELGNVDAARHAVLSEIKGIEGFTDCTPARTKNHPFSKKILTEQAAYYVSVWRGQDDSRNKILYQACPDFALRDPLPFTILGEGKLFKKGSTESAAMTLAVALSETMFYLGLPEVSASEQRPAWDYQFACLVLYDASPDHAVTSAWESFNVEVRDGFWDSGNIFVMIITH